jgi:putative addiction module CopG family antidote
MNVPDPPALLDSRLDNLGTIDHRSTMEIALPPALGKLVERLIRTGRYMDEGDVIREALRALERQELNESPALEAAVLEGVGSPHLPYDDTVLERIRRNARSQA